MSNMNFTALAHMPYSQTMQEFGELFNALCERQKTTPYQVSLEVGLPQATMSYIVTGRRKPRTEHLKKIAESKSLNVDYRTLLAMKI